jgi:lipoprotein-anchoring transpeptidase ErfK/SrfK
MLRAAALTAALSACLALPAGASAQAPAGRMFLSVQRDYGYRGQQIALQGQELRVKGIVTPYVEGEQVSVTITGAGARPLVVSRTASKQGARGVFFIDFKARRTGRVRVSATHAASQALGAASARSKVVTVITPRAAGGASGLRVRFLQQRLQALRYLIGLTGTYDEQTRRAVLAFHKVNREARITSASERTFTLLARYQGGFKAKHPNHGRHVEADLQRQVIALVNPGGRVFKVIQTSTGKPSTPTVVGSFRFYSKTPGTNTKGMVDSNYFIRGYAIHGYPEVPTYPASHGCLRIPIPNARFVFGWVQLGERIDVYLRGGRTQY